MIQQETPTPGGRQQRRQGGALHQGARRLAPPLRLDRRHLRRHRQGRHPRRRGQEGRRRQVRRRPHQEGEASSGRQLHPLRRERRRAHQRRAAAPRAPASSARSAASCATRSSCASSRSHRRCCDEDEAEEGRPRRRAHRQGPRQEGRDHARPARSPARSSSTASTSPRSTRRPPGATMQGGIIDKDMPIAGVGRERRQPGRRQADPRRLPLRRPGQQGPHLRPHGGGSADGRPPATLPRLKAALRHRDPRPAEGHARPRQHHGGAALREDRHQHGRRPGHPAGLAARGRRPRPHDDHRPEAARHQGQEVDRRLQAARGQLHRLQGHAARRPHVGVLRPARHRSPSPASATSAACPPRASTAAATTRSASPSS